MKVGDLVVPKNMRHRHGMENPHRIGLIIGESHGSYNGPLAKVQWNDVPYPLAEPMRYLELASESR